MRASVRAGWICAAAFLAAGCHDLARVNPYDPAARFEIILQGPTVAQTGDTITFTAETTLPWTHRDGPEWSTLDARVLDPLGDGRYVARQSGSTRIQVRYGTHVAIREVVVSP